MRGARVHIRSYARTHTYTRMLNCHTNNGRMRLVLPAYNEIPAFRGQIFRLGAMHTTGSLMSHRLWGNLMIFRSTI